jgi:hypothetical protein
MMEGLRTPMELVVTVVILLSYGCPAVANAAYEAEQRILGLGNL